MMPVKRLSRRRNPALSVVAATAAAGVSLLLVSPNCYGVQASPSLESDVQETPLFSHDAVATDQSRRRAEEDGQVGKVTKLGRTVAHRRSSSAYALAAGSSLGLPKSLGPTFLAASALLAATSLLGLGREGRHGGGGASGRGVEEEGNVEELLRTAGATSGVGTAAGLPKSLLSKNLVLSLAALGLLFVASSLAGRSSLRGDRQFKQVKVTADFRCTSGRGRECVLNFHPSDGGETFRDHFSSYRTALRLRVPSGYRRLLDPELNAVFRNELLESFFLPEKHMQESGTVEVNMPFPVEYEARFLSVKRPETSTPQGDVEPPVHLRRGD